MNTLTSAQTTKKDISISSRSFEDKKYPPHKIETIDERYICGVCKFLYQNVNQTWCGCRCCFECTKEFKNDICLLCDEIFPSDENNKKFVPDTAFQKELDRLTVDCVNCDWNGINKEYKDHYKNHESGTLDVKNELKMEIKTMYREIDDRLIRLENRNSSTITTKQTDEKNINPKITEISERIQIVEINQKLVQFDLNKISSIESDTGNLREIRNFYETNTGNISRGIQNLQENLIILEQRLNIQENSSFNGSLLWRITNVSDKIQEARNGRQRSIYSTPFYTTQYGYKVCCEIYLDGDDEYIGTHISLYFVIMMGEYDALLRWPFRQNVKMILIDQSQRGDIVRTLRPDPNSISFQRPILNMNNPYGFRSFCLLTELYSADHEYIQDDCMFVKVSVDYEDPFDFA